MAQKVVGAKGGWVLAARPRNHRASRRPVSGRERREDVVVVVFDGDGDGDGSPG